jgi:hypothetical protein
MTLKPIAKRASLGIVYIDFGIVTAGQDFVTVEQEARNHMSVVSTKSEVLGLAF